MSTESTPARYLKPLHASLQKLYKSARNRRCYERKLRKLHNQSGRSGESANLPNHIPRVLKPVSDSRRDKVWFSATAIVSPDSPAFNPGQIDMAAMAPQPPRVPVAEVQSVQTVQMNEQNDYENYEMPVDRGLKIILLQPVVTRMACVLGSEIAYWQRIGPTPPTRPISAILAARLAEDRIATGRSPQSQSQQ
jgi:hypothetical protein